MTISEFINSKGLSVWLVAQEMGISERRLCSYGTKRSLTAESLKDIARAMKKLGIPTTAAEIYQAVQEK